MKNLNAASVKKVLEKAVEKKKASIKHSIGLFGNYGQRNPEKINYRNLIGVYKPTLNQFQNYSGKYIFRPEHLYATSYGWWVMLTKIKGKLVLNQCNYSQQTSIHQGLLASAMRELKIKPDLVVSCKANLRNPEQVKQHYLEDLAVLTVKLENCQKKNILYYKAQIKKVEKKIKEIEKAKIGLRFSKKDRINAIENARIKRIQNLSWKREQKRREIGFKSVSNASSDFSPAQTYPKLTLVKG